MYAKIHYYPLTCHCTVQAWNGPNAALFTAAPHMSVFTETEQTPARPPGVAETQTSNDNGFQHSVVLNDTLILIFVS